MELTLKISKDSLEVFYCAIVQHCCLLVPSKMICLLKERAPQPFLLISGSLRCIILTKACASLQVLVINLSET